MPRDAAVFAPAVGVREDMESELGVLGAMLAEPACIPEATRLVRPGHFHRTAHANTFAALLALHARGEAPDLVSLAHELRARNVLEESGGMVFVSGLLDTSASGANLRFHARRVRAAWAARSRARIGLELANGACHAPEVAAALASELEAISRDESGPDGQSAAAAWAALSLSGDALLSSSLPTLPSWLGDGILPAGELAFLTGHSGVGKTFLAVQIISALSVGHTFCGLPTRQCRVGLVELEMPWVSVQHRLKALHTLDAGATAFICSPPGAVHVTEPSSRDNLCEFIRLHRLDVLILDPFNRLHDADENSGSDMGHVLEGLHDIRWQTGVSMLVLHHVRKQPSGLPGGPSSRSASLDAGRGSSRLTNDPATVIVLDESKGFIRMTFAKVRHAESPAPIYLKRNAAGFFDVAEDPAAAKVKRQDALRAMLDRSGNEGVSSRLASDILKVTERTLRRDFEEVGATFRQADKRWVNTELDTSPGRLDF